MKEVHWLQKKVDGISANDVISENQRKNWCFTRMTVRMEQYAENAPEEKIRRLDKG